jgi:hypothetical protein
VLLFGLITITWVIFFNWTHGYHQNEAEYLDRLRLRQILTEEAETKHYMGSLGRFYNLIHTSSNILASDPMAKVYGMYSILKTLGINLPQPEYSNPVAQVYEDFAIAPVRETKSLSLPITTLPSSSNKYNLPS